MTPQINQSTLTAHLGRWLSQFEFFVFNFYEGAIQTNNYVHTMAYEN